MPKINKYYVLERKRRGRSEANEAPIADVLQQFMQKTHIDFNPNEKKVKNLYFNIVGSYIAQFTTNINMFNNVLYVKVSLPTIKAELLMIRDALKNKINLSLGSEIVKNIIIK